MKINIDNYNRIDEIIGMLDDILDEDVEEQYLTGEGRAAIEKTQQTLRELKNDFKIKKVISKRQMLKKPKSYLQAILDGCNVGYSDKLTKKELIDQYYVDLSDGILEEYENA